MQVFLSDSWLLYFCSAPGSGWRWQWTEAGTPAGQGRWACPRSFSHQPWKGWCSLGKSSIFSEGQGAASKELPLAILDMSWYEEPLKNSTPPLMVPGPPESCVDKGWGTGSAHCVLKKAALWSFAGHRAIHCDLSDMKLKSFFLWESLTLMISWCLSWSGLKERGRTSGNV